MLGEAGSKPAKYTCFRYCANLRGISKLFGNADFATIAESERFAAEGLDGIAAAT